MNNMKRMRGRNHRGGQGGGQGGPIRHSGGGSGNIPLNRNHVFDSSGPDLRIRGTAQQLFEKYLQLGRDATGGGDRVMAESYFQYAEHYFRILNAIVQATQPAGGGQPGAHQGGQAGSQPGGTNGHDRQRRPHEPQQMQDDPDEDEPEPGFGDQPATEARDIPISAAPPE